MVRMLRLFEVAFCATEGSTNGEARSKIAVNEDISPIRRSLPMTSTSLTRRLLGLTTQQGFAQQPPDLHKKVKL
jgi:hypothetical protein